MLQASRSLAIMPANQNALSKTARDSAAFAFLKILAGFGVAPDSSQLRMLTLEATQETATALSSKGFVLPWW
jgi:hypothetical protein